MRSRTVVALAAIVLGFICTVVGVISAQNEKPGGSPPATPQAPPPPATAPAGGGGGGGGFWNFIFGAPSSQPPQGLALPADGVPRASGFYKLKFQATVHADRGPRRVQMSYVLYLPKGYEAGKDPCPAVVFLHGAGEAGTDADGIFVHGPAMEVQRQAGSKFADSFPFIIVGPQCPPRGERWDQQVMLRAVLALLDELQTKVRIDPDRVYVTGLSMGGKGTWLLAMEAPQRFAAIAPIAADTLDTQGAQRLKYTSVWAIDGALDFGGGPENNQKMVEAIQKAGGDAKVSIVPGEGHFVWARFYGEPSFYDWFLQHKRLSDSERKQRDSGAARAGG